MRFLTGRRETESSVIPVECYIPSERCMYKLILNTIEVNSLQEPRFGNQLQVCKLGVVNFTKRFIVIKIFQILVLPPVSFYTHQNI